MTKCRLCFVEKPFALAKRARPGSVYYNQNHWSVDTSVSRTDCVTSGTISVRCDPFSGNHLDLQMLIKILHEAKWKETINIRVTVTEDTNSHTHNKCGRQISNRVE
ncbi:hypothetical protein RRG08_057055 [Elysia crispata]|uniref:Uncharacterized protein n=1 Tax=Elysia crispata TaxID=231223 RepID=A0AAE1DBB5_9GAST|nr:hypothetical protein RRG08_057055 [Elysia crispata]